MKKFVVKNLVLAAVSVAVLSVASVASAGDWRRHGFYGPVVRYHAPAIRFGIGVGIGVVEPVYVAPAPPVFVPEVVVGGYGHYYGRPYYRGREFVRVRGRAF